MQWFANPFKIKCNWGHYEAKTTNSICFVNTVYAHSEFHSCNPCHLFFYQYSVSNWEQRTPLLCRHIVLKHWHCPAGIRNDFPKNDIILLRANVVSKPVCTVPFSVKGAITDEQFHHTMDTNYWILNLLGTIYAFFLFNQKDTVS